MEVEHNISLSLSLSHRFLFLSPVLGPGRTSDDAIVIDDGDSATTARQKLNSKLEMAHVTTPKVLDDFEKNVSW